MASSFPGSSSLEYSLKWPPPTDGQPLPAGRRFRARFSWGSRLRCALVGGSRAGAQGGQSIFDLRGAPLIGRRGEEERGLMSSNFRCRPITSTEVARLPGVGRRQCPIQLANLGTQLTSPPLGYPMTSHTGHFPPRESQSIQGEIYEENLDMVFSRFRSIGEYRMVASPDDQRDREGGSCIRRTMASSAKDK